MRMIDTKPRAFSFLSFDLRCLQHPATQPLVFALGPRCYLVRRAERRLQKRDSPHTHSCQASRQLEPPRTSVDIDEDLWAVLDICSCEELEDIHKILFGGSFLSPLVKSLVGDNEPPAVALRGRTAVMRRIESRFRFLAADPQATLRGHRPSYRETLLAVRDRLCVQCPGGLATQDLESEIFLSLLRRQAEAAQELVDNADDAAAAKLRLQQRTPAKAIQQKWADLMHTFTMGAPEMGESAAKVAGAFGVANLRKTTMQRLAQQLLLQRARYQMALKVVCKSGAPVMQREAGLKAAQAGLTNAAARYGTASGAFSLLGPIMWTWLAVDLARQSIGTDFQRVTKAVYALAQVRLLRTHGFINPL